MPKDEADKAEATGSRTVKATIHPALDTDEHTDGPLTFKRGETVDLKPDEFSHAKKHQTVQHGSVYQTVVDANAVAPDPEPIEAAGTVVGSAQRQ